MNGWILPGVGPVHMLEIACFVRVCSPSATTRIITGRVPWRVAPTLLLWIREACPGMSVARENSGGTFESTFFF